MRVFFFDAFSSLFCLLPGHVLAKIECDNFMTLNIHSLQRLTDDRIDILPSNYQVPIHKANEIPFTHTHAPNLHRANGGGNFGRLNDCSSLGHGFAIRLKVSLKIKSEKRS